MNNFNKNKIIIRKVLLNDINEILILFKLIFKSEISTQYYIWKYFDLKLNFFNSYVALHDAKIIGHIGFNKKELKINNHLIPCISRHTSMVHLKFRKNNIYNNITQLAILDFKKQNIPIMLLWPNVNNFISSYKILNFNLVFSSSILSYNNFNSKNNKDININNLISSYTLKKLNIKSLKKINLRTFHKNDYWQINKNKSYIVKRYIDDPDNVYYHDTYQHDNKQSSIIFKFTKNSINIMDVFTNKNFFNLHLEKFLKNINNKNLKVNVLCNIYSDIYMIFILNNFKNSDKMYNCGIYSIKSNTHSKDILKNLNKFNFSMGDTDVF